MTAKEGRKDTEKTDSEQINKNVMMPENINVL